MQQLVKKSFIKVFPISISPDNYSYFLLRSDNEQDAKFGALVDPADPPRVLSFLEKFPSIAISHVLFTHKHSDHTGDVKQLAIYLQARQQKMEQNQQIHYVASEVDGKYIDNLTLKLSGKVNKIQVSNIDGSAYLVPCHTRGHLLYFFEADPNNKEISKIDKEIQVNGMVGYACQKALFTGDTLFIGGCGRFFEGNAQQMLSNMDLIAQFPLDTNAFVGHEYTLSNYQWAAGVDFENGRLMERLKWANNQIKQGLTTLPSTIQEELQTNIFMRCRDQSLQQKLNLTDPVEIMDKLRQMKNNNQILKPYQINL